MLSDVVGSKWLVLNMWRIICHFECVTTFTSIATCCQDIINMAAVEKTTTSAMLFDMDGTLLGTCAWYVAAHAYQIPLPLLRLRGETFPNNAALISPRSCTVSLLVIVCKIVDDPQRLMVYVPSIICVDCRA